MNDRAIKAVQVSPSQEGNTSDSLKSLKSTHEMNKNTPISLGQQRLYLFDKVFPDSPVCNKAMKFLFTGSLNKKNLEISINLLIQRHEDLRSRFMMVDGVPVQFVDTSLTLPLQVIDLEYLPDQIREASLQCLIEEETLKIFDLETGPLLRCILFRLTTSEHVLLFTIHSIIFDSWSLDIFIDDFIQIYSAQQNHTFSLPATFADVVVDQQQYLRTTDPDMYLAYWKQYYTAAPTMLELPVDYTYPPIPTFQSTRYNLKIPPHLANAVRTLSQQEGYSLFTVLVAAIKTLLYRYTGQDTILVNTPLPNRMYPEMKELVGHFENMLVLCTKFSKNMTFQELLGKIHKDYDMALTQQDLPFEKFLEDLIIERNVLRKTLVPVECVLHPALSSIWKLPELVIKFIDIDIGMAKSDLKFDILETSEGLSGYIEYGTNLFEEATIARMAGHFQILLEGCITHPDLCLVDLPLLTLDERQQILTEWNATEVEYPPLCLHEFFEAQVERTPEAIALVFEDSYLTYGELDAHANQLAQYLQRLGVEADSHVGICLERSLELVVGLLGILKAGGAYVPLDPEYPAERLAFMLSDAQVSVLLLQEHLLGQMPLHQVRCIYLDSEWSCIQKEEVIRPISKVRPDHLAYVIYTSGSTGVPKGAMLTHRGICNRLLWMLETYQLNGSDRILQKTPSGFDVSVWEFFCPLLAGACLVLARPGGQRESGYLVEVIAEQQISALHFVPSMLSVFLNEPAIEKFSWLKWVICSGEVLPIDLQKRFFTHMNAQLYNLYGPTEVSVEVTFWRCDPLDRGMTVPIGRPIANTQIYLLDHRGNMVPAGVPAELYIGGIGLARGYFNRPHLTAERFIPDPFSRQPGARLYRTGDMARYRPDGSIAFLGRLDQQIKARGYRIEPGEIEAALQQHPVIQEALVLAHEDRSGDKLLVAYLRGAQEKRLFNNEIRALLGQTLPDYMLPDAFVWLDDFPLTPNGKLDRRALPVPERSHRIWKLAAAVAPRIPEEDLLLGLWQQVLGIEEISIYDSFFELGGHSLLATQLLSRISAVFQIDLPFQRLFQTPTIVELAQVVMQLQASTFASMPPLHPMTRLKHLPLSFAQQRLWFLEQLHPGTVAYNIPTTLRLRGKLDRNALERSFNEIVRRHETLRTHFVMVEGQPVQVIEARWNVTLPIISLRALSQEQQVELLQVLFAQEAHYPFRLETGPLLRAWLVELEEQEHVLLMNMHHVIIDGWSLGIFNCELSQLYEAFVREQASPLAGIGVQYADFTLWQREWLQGTVLEQHLSYWRERLLGAPTLLNLPTDHPRPAVRTFRGAEYRYLLPVSLMQELKTLSQSRACTLFMTLLAAFQVLLMRYSGQTDIVVGTPIANRTRIETEPLIGFFVNTLLLRTTLSGEPDFSQVLALVREACLGAYAHQDLPFEKLVEALAPERLMSYNPLFQVMFILQNAPEVNLDLFALTTDVITTHNGSAKFDLTMSMSETSAGLTVCLEYSTNLFETTTIARMGTHFQRLLEAVVRAPHQPVSQLTLLTEAEQQQILHEWNAPIVVSEHHRCFHQFFEQQVARTPDAIALVYEEAQLTYATLNDRADRLARTLQARGVGPEVLVGICMERSLSLLIGVLGILKAGGAYVPLDPSAPPERLALMLQDAQVALLLMQTEDHQQVRARQSPPVLFLDTMVVVEEIHQVTQPTYAQADTAAYVIYTSGSTGHPKGVVVTQSGLMHYLSWCLKTYGIAEGQGTLVHSSISFDLIITALFPPLLVGKRVVLLPEGHLVEHLSQALQRERDLSLLKLTPSHLELLNTMLSATDSVGLSRTLIIGGETLQEAHLAFWRKHSPDVRLINEYGPTEAVVGCATYEVTAQEELSGPVPIGRPITNTQLYILDGHLLPVPIGVVGMLYIGGEGLARGYLHQPETTAEKFVPHCFSTRPGSRLYQTGDLARYRIDGNIEFLGRADQQVKIHGYRVELGEVEATLRKHPVVREALVIAHEDPSRRRHLVAYVLLREKKASSVSQLRDYLKTYLPDYMLPEAFVILDTLPLTQNGKVDTKALPLPDKIQANPKTMPASSLGHIEQAIIQVWQEVLQIEHISMHDNFFDLGGHSWLIIQAYEKLRTLSAVSLSVVDMFKYPTVMSLARYLHQEKEAPAPLTQEQYEAKKLVEDNVKTQREEIAIIGMSGRFPGADNVEAFWQNVSEGVESISFFSDEQVETSLPISRNNPHYVKAAGVVNNIEEFDASFFAFTPREAEITDPQHRLFLECAWEALEQAGYDPATYEGAIGIYAGAGGENSYFLNNLSSHPDLLERVGRLQVMFGNEKDHLPLRTAYRLNLRGPAIAVQTTCSTSLVAVHLGCQALLNSDCDIVLTGGAAITVPQRTGYIYREGEIYSPDGHCRAFDANAQGTVGSNGVGIVVLKRLSEALADGDTIYAVIKGSAINNDGRSRVGYSAPGINGQAAVIAKAQMKAGVNPETIGYIEAHGTGTILGDPIEVAALIQAFQSHSVKKHYCAIGSVKTNIGHLDVVAGVTGLIKTALALKHKLLPPSLHFVEPNPQIDFENSPFYVNTELTAWETHGTPRRAGVSSFGIGGTNAHLVLEEAPAARTTCSMKSWHLLVLSARTDAALETMTTNLLNFLKQQIDIDIADVAYTLHVGRAHFNHRRILRCQEIDDAIATLEARETRKVLTAICKPGERLLAFLFPGQGTQYVNMGRDLYAEEPFFSQQVDLCASLLLPHLGSDIRNVLYPSEEYQQEAEQLLSQTAFAQPALFVVEYALARMWMEWGVQPQAMIGHSLGEYVAACIAGVFSLEEALMLVVVRGRLMQQVPAGAMLTITCSEQESLSLIKDTSLTIAAVNTPLQCVVSGELKDIDALRQKLLALDISHHLLHTSRAFHSPMMEPIMEAFLEQVRQVHLCPPHIAYISNLTGDWITPEQATDPTYWTMHLRQTVRFNAGAKLLVQKLEGVVLELGPGKVLEKFVKSHLDENTNIQYCASLQSKQKQHSDQSYLLSTLGLLWLGGVPLQWSKFYTHELRQRIPLPTYPFERQRYWVEPRVQKNPIFTNETSLSTNADHNNFSSRPLDRTGVIVEAENPHEETFSSSTYARSVLLSEYAAPASEIERILVAIWHELLGIAEIGIYDNFFELGGDSLLASRVIARIQSMLQVKLPLRSIFKAQTIAALARHIEEDDQHERQHIQPLLPVSRDHRLPLSYGQERLWFLQQLAPDNPYYNVPSALHLIGVLSVKALQQSFQAVIQRHEVLRTTFCVCVEGPTQIINEAINIDIPLINLTELDKGQQESTIQHLMRTEARRLFDLEHGPMLRVLLLRLSREEHYILWTVHHIAIDGWSQHLMLQELAALYQAYTSGGASPLSALPIQYADYAVHQRQWLQGALLNEEMTYWRRYLAGAPTIFELPSDHPRPAMLTFRGAKLDFVLSRELTDALKALSYQEDITLFVILLSAFQIFLSRYSGKNDFLIGTFTANRTRIEEERLIGFLTNTLVIRAHLSGNRAVREVLQQINEEVFGAFSHQYLPFEEIVKDAHPERDNSHTPLFQVAFIMQNLPTYPWHLPGLQVEQIEIELGVSAFDLMLSVVEVPEGILGSFVYSTDLFEESTIEHMVGHFQMLLEGLVANLDQRIHGLSLLTQEEQQRQLYAWNDTGMHYPEHRCVHQLFEQQARETPLACALTYDERQITYQEMNATANQLAYYLMHQGVGPETIVGICMERIPELFIAIIAILKAGGAYLPLDYTYPAERIQFMLNDAHIHVLLTQSHLEGFLPEHHLPLIALDQEWEKCTVESTQNTQVAVLPENIAYIVYTSGSTGKPKGVSITQQNFTNGVVALKETYGLQIDDRALQFHSPSFDASIEEIFPTLIAGATLVVPALGAEMAGIALARFCEQQRISILHLPVSFWHQWITVLTNDDIPTLSALRVLEVGGESPSLEKLRSWRCIFTHPMKFLNAYGPTEATLCSSVYEICLGDGADLDQLSIGRATANKELYILDSELNLLPVGIPGELHIGGVGLARGYLHHPELTAEKFIPHPFCRVPGARLYQTGDLARYQIDGTIEILGRIDRQVKIRGFRVELGEIEHFLEAQATIQSAIVLDMLDSAGSIRLVAYVVPVDPATFSISDVQVSLKKQLPEYMIPGIVMPVQSLALTMHGKIDRKELPLPDWKRHHEELSVSPRTPTEEIVADIWSEVLHLEQVSIDSNFFDLGGHSLNATQVVSRIRELLHLELPLRQIFATPTIAKLAEIITSNRGIRKSLLPTVIYPAPREERLPLSFAQERLWFIEQLSPENRAHTIIFLLRFEGPLDKTALGAALNEIVQRHEVLRTSFMEIEGVPQQMIAPNCTVPFPLVDLQMLNRDMREELIQLFAVQSAEVPFTLKDGPLFRMQIIHMAATEYLLQFAIHHSIFDAWSMGIFYAELTLLYKAQRAKGAAPLPPLSIQYADFAYWQRQHFQGAVFEEHRAYWREYLADVPTLLQLPTDYPRPLIQVFHGATYNFVLLPDLLKQLKAMSRHEGVTLFMTLMAAFQVLLYRYSGQEAFLVGTPIANRNQMQTEKLLGFFVNTLVLRADFSDQPTFRELLMSVREATLEAYAHQDMPFEKMVEALQPERDLSRNPLFQVMFILQNAPMDVPAFDDLTVTEVDSPMRTALFDLTLECRDTEEGFFCQIDYKTDLFKPATIRQMAEHYQALLESVIVNQEEVTSLLPMLTPAEAQQIWQAQSASYVNYPHNVCIQTLFEAQVARTPHACAVAFDEVELNYEELNKRANQLAHYLQRSGVGPQMRVGIYLHRSIDMLIGVLGSIKAGAAYVPLDPAYPRERVAYMLQDAHIVVLLTHQSLIGNLPAHNAQVVFLNTDWQHIKRESEENPTSQVTSEDLLYVFYTSGSTGQPKGVQTTHRAVVNYALEAARRFRLHAEDRFLQFASLSFAVSVEEIFPIWLSGGTVVLSEGKLLSSPSYLLTVVQQAQITVCELPTSYWHEWIQELLSSGTRPPTSLRLVIIGGERVLPERLRTWQTFGISLINVYGLTETTITSTVYEPDLNADEWSHLPIGRPVANTQVYLLDRLMQPVPYGVAGEIYVGGDSLAQSYLNRPDLTAERFVPHPFSQAPGARLYMTGDIAHCLSDGVIDFLGRRDRQVKLRGFRIELDEIEKALSHHPLVQDSVVLVREDTPNNKLLVAYVVGKHGSNVSHRQLRLDLKEQLPDYMIPAYFIFLDVLPLAPNGKIDHRALPVPTFAANERMEAFVAPQTPVEEVLAWIYSDILQLDEVGIHENFFELGGHSLLTTRVIAHLRETLQIELPIRALFEAPTVAELAHYITKLNDTSYQDVLRIAQMLVQVSNLSDDETQAILTEKQMIKKQMIAGKYREDHSL